MENYFKILDKDLIGMRNNKGDFIYLNGGWKKDKQHLIEGRQNCNVPSAAEDNVSGLSMISMMFNLEKISKKEAFAFIDYLHQQKVKVNFYAGSSC